MKKNYLIILSLVFALSGCQSTPPAPKKPKACPRAWINQSLPVEVQGDGI